ncbi:regulatory protein YycI of two-component signal transduction system YycFG [Defluviitalea raffinosedens]|nr:regulatory protein YycI of two-component signal transduction system YycFG [Defluviitalea raffinosedens]
MTFCKERSNNEQGNKHCKAMQKSTLLQRSRFFILIFWRCDMLIAWQYLDKKAAAVEALKDYSSMQYIIEHSDEDIYEVETRMTSPHSAKITGVPGKHNPQKRRRTPCCLP